MWIDEYVRVLSDSDRQMVLEKQSKSIFRFGDGKETSSLMLKIIPVVMGKKKMMLDVDVVENDIPLLLSKGAIEAIVDSSTWEW